MKKESIIICASHSFKDPLFNGLIYQYILQFQKEQPKKYSYHFFTEEMPAYRLSEAEQNQLKASLAKQDIHWHPMIYRGGKMILFKKLWNFIGLFFQIWKIKRQEKAKLIIGFLAIAGAYSYLIAKVLRFKIMIFCFEPHSLYMKEFGIWSASSPKYKLLSQLEYWQATQSDYVVAPTIHTIELLQQWQSKAQLMRVPISVDTQKFEFSQSERNQLRKQYHIPAHRYSILYLGKFGGIYYDPKQVAAYCKRLIDFDKNIFIFTITPNPLDEVEAAFLEAGLAPSDFLLLGKIPYDKIQAYISACDMGLVAIPPLESQKYRTPVKIGNYLACGIPFIVTRGIADDDIMAEKERVGVVWDSLDKQDFEAPLTQLKEFINEDRAVLQARCRQAAIKHRGIQNSVLALQKAIKEVYS